MTVLSTTQETSHNGKDRSFVVVDGVLSVIPTPPLISELNYRRTPEQHTHTRVKTRKGFVPTHEPSSVLSPRSSPPPLAAGKQETRSNFLGSRVLTLCWTHTPLNPDWGLTPCSFTSPCMLKCGSLYLAELQGRLWHRIRVLWAPIRHRVSEAAASLDPCTHDASRKTSHESEIRQHFLLPSLPHIGSIISPEVSTVWPGTFFQERSSTLGFKAA